MEKNGPNSPDFQQKKFLDDYHFSYITKLGEKKKKKNPGLDVANLTISKRLEKIFKNHKFREFLKKILKTMIPKLQKSPPKIETC
jgi:hypothetical protein